MTIEVNNEKPIIECETCHGQGWINQALCQQCSGKGQGLWLEGNFVYWDKKITSLSIAFDRVKVLLQNLINGILIILTVVCLIFFYYHLMLSFKSSIKIWEAFIYPTSVGFWFAAGILLISYISYRFEHQLQNFTEVLKRGYQARITPEHYLFDWQELVRLSGRNKVSASRSFNGEAIKAVNKSFSLASKFGHEKVTALHLLISLISFNRVGNIFSRLGVPFSKLKEKVGNGLSTLSKNSTNPELSNELKRILLLAYYNAWKNHQEKVGLSELLLAITQDKNLAAEALFDLKIDLEKMSNVVLWVRVQKQLYENYLRFKSRSKRKPKSKMNRAMTAIATPILDSFGQDLTLLAQNGYLEPCIGREAEFDAIFRLIESGKKSMILVGLPGVGKTTIIEGLAQRMAEENVPEVLRDKRLVSLSIARLVSGATPAEAQERLMLGLQEMAISGNIILFIKDIQGMIGISAGGHESIDLAGTLVAALKQLGTFCLASCAPSEYSRYIEPHGSLGSFLNKIEINEPGRNETIQILEAKTPHIEGRERIYFSYDAIERAEKLSERYIHDRYLPQKAILLIEEAASFVRKNRGENSLIVPQDIAELVSQKTKIKVTEVTAEEGEKLLHLEEIIHERIIGQEEAVKAVATSLRRARAELRDTKRPIANLLFLGPTGVGKTELAKTIADVYFAGEAQMLRLDMSEYKTSESIDLLIGSSRNGENSGYLTEGVRKNPYNVVLLDEFEKAHPDVLNLFLQVMDDGRLTDSSGRTIDFTNVIIIATSNAGTQTIQDEIRKGSGIEEIKKILLEVELKKYFKPELLNRFDNVVVFKPLAIKDVVAITRLLLKAMEARLKAKGIYLEVSEEAVIELAQAGFDPIYGARPLKRVLAEKIDDVLANYLLSNKLERRDIVVLGRAGQISIRKGEQL